MSAVTLGLLYLQICMSRFLTLNPPLPRHFPGHFYDLHGAVITSSCVLFSPHCTGFPWGHRCYLVCLKVLSNAALLSQSSKVVVSSEELARGKTDRESSFFLLQTPKAGLWHPGHPFSLRVPRECPDFRTIADSTTPRRCCDYSFSALLKAGYRLGFSPGSPGAMASLPGIVYGQGLGTGPNKLLTVF